MCTQPGSPSSPERRRASDGLCRALTDRLLLLVASVALAFLLWSTALHGMAVKDHHTLRAWSERFFILLCIALAPSAVLETRNALHEGLKRQELPPTQAPSSSMEERSFRTAGPTRSLIRHCTGLLNQRFRRFYAFHRYQAPYVVHFYYAKKGSLALLGLPLTRTGFLLLFLFFSLSLLRRDFPARPGWEWGVLGMGCLLLVTGLLIRFTVSYRKFWLRICEENNRVWITLNGHGRRRGREFERLYSELREFEPHAEVVSCSTQAR